MLLELTTAFLYGTIQRAWPLESRLESRKLHAAPMPWLKHKALLNE